MMAQMNRGRLDLLRPLTAGCLAATNAPFHPAALSSQGSSGRVLRLHRAGSGHSGLRSACRLPSEASRRDRFLPDLRAALRQVCRSLRAALRAPLGAAASRSAGGGRAVPRVRPAPGRFCPPSLPFVQERTPGGFFTNSCNLRLIRRFSCQLTRGTRLNHSDPAEATIPKDSDIGVKELMALYQGLYGKLLL